MRLSPGFSARGDRGSPHHAAFSRLCLATAPFGAAALLEALDAVAAPTAAGVNRDAGHPSAALEALTAVGTTGTAPPPTGCTPMSCPPAPRTPASRPRTGLADAALPVDATYAYAAQLVEKAGRAP